MIPTPIDLRRIEKAKRIFKFDPRDIGGDNHIWWWFAAKQDEHFDHDNEFEQDCFEGDVVVLVKQPDGYPKSDHGATDKPNWVTMIQQHNGTTSYIFQPTSKLTTTKEE